MVDEPLSIIQSAEFEFRNFLYMLKTQKNCSTLASKRSDRDLMNARFPRAFTDVENHKISRREVLYNKYVLEILWGQVLLAGD